jgi:hypothetical protein
MSRQTKIFAHGIWADDSSFSKLIPTLGAEGHDVIAAQYGLNTHAGDVAANAVEQASKAAKVRRTCFSGPADAKDQVPLPTSAEFMRGNTQTHEIVDALTAAVLNAEAGLVWLRADPPHLEEVRGALSSIVNDIKRAGEIVVRLRALMNKVPTADGSSDP